MKIFISYRRADSKYVVDRIRDRLISAYNEETVFRDIESIPLGEDFREVLERSTHGCNVMLVVIGPQWASITDAQGNKRLSDPNDFTRIEVETGLANKDILVIPVRVMNAGSLRHRKSQKACRTCCFATQSVCETTRISTTICKD